MDTLAPTLLLLLSLVLLLTQINCASLSGDSSDNLVHEQDNDIVKKYEGYHQYQSAPPQAPLPSSFNHFKQKFSHLSSGGSASTSANVKADDRVDLKQLQDFLVEFEEDPTGTVANLVATSWNWLPPLTGVEVRKNFNKLKSGFDAAHFMGRDTVVWIGGSLMWVVLHYIFWDGRVNSMEDLEASIRSPGVKVELPSHADLANGVTQPDTSDDVKGNTFVETPQFERLWNSLASPDSSTRRLYTNVLYGLASQILWIIPTFIGKIPVPEKKQDISDGILQDISNYLDPADDRLLGLPDNLLNAPVEKNWNRLMSLQGVFANICINILNYIGRWIFWSFATRGAI